MTMTTTTVTYGDGGAAATTVIKEMVDGVIFVPSG